MECLWEPVKTIRDFIGWIYGLLDFFYVTEEFSLFSDNKINIFQSSDSIIDSLDINFDVLDYKQKKTS